MTQAFIPASDPEHQQQHLSTAHLGSHIKSRMISGTLVSAVAQGSQFILSVAYTAAVARLLTPHDFGVVAMVLTVSGILQVFRDAGLSTATIQREEITHAQVSNLFWLNVAVSALAGCMMAVAAPFLAWFFREPELIALSIVLSSGFLLDGLAVQHLALLNRQMQFRTVSTIEVASLAAGCLVGVAMAFLGWGYWSLVGGGLSTAGVRLIAAWTMSPWRPQAPRRGTGSLPLMRFGADLTLVGIVYALSRGADSLLVGRFFGAEAVGLYSRATALLTRPLERLMSPIYSAIVPALSRLQMEPLRYRRAFLEVLEAVAILGFLFTGLFFPLAHPLVVFVLGWQWEAVAPIFAALTLAALHLPITVAASWLYTSQGRGRDLLLTTCLGSSVMVAACVFGLRFGPAGVAAAYSISGLLIGLPLTLFVAGRRGPVSTLDSWLALTRHLPLLGIVLTATWLARSAAPTLPPLPQLLLCGSVGLLAGTATVLLFPPTRRTAGRLLNELNQLRNR